MVVNCSGIGNSFKGKKEEDDGHDEEESAKCSELINTASLQQARLGGR